MPFRNPGEPHTDKFDASLANFKVTTFQPGPTQTLRQLHTNCRQIHSSSQVQDKMFKLELLLLRFSWNRLPKDRTTHSLSRLSGDLTYFCSRLQSCTFFLKQNRECFLPRHNGRNPNFRWIPPGQDDKRVPSSVAANARTTA